MKTYTKTIKSVLKSITCDKCKECYDVDINLFEVQEFLSYVDVCGYGAVYNPEKFKYADGDQISLDLCQYCKNELLGPYMTIIKCSRNA